MWYNGALDTGDYSGEERLPASATLASVCRSYDLAEEKEKKTKATYPSLMSSALLS